MHNSVDVECETGNYERRLKCSRHFYNSQHANEAKRTTAVARREQRETGKPQSLVFFTLRRTIKVSQRAYFPLATKPGDSLWLVLCATLLYDKLCHVAR